jgi:hypothetical protein
VKHLARSGKPHDALAFFYISRCCAKKALKVGQKENLIQPVDYEVLFTPEFMLSQIPLLGVLWRNSAEKPLHEALNLMQRQIGLGEFESVRVLHALIHSKLYRLTGYEISKANALMYPFKKSDDENQLKRIVKHLGLKSIEELPFE